VLTTLVFLAFMGFCTAYYLVKTPVYRVEARILAQRQQAMPGIVRPSSAEDAPTRSAYDLVHRRENLLTLLKQAGVLARLVNAPATPGQLDALQRLLPGSEAAGDRDPVDELVLLLDKDLVINSTEGSINLSIDWPNAAEAFKLIEAAVQNFLEARHVQEITARDEAISLLQGRVATLRERLDRSIEETRRQVPRRYEVALDARPTGASAGIPATEELVKVKSLIDAKERAIGDVEEFRRRRLADLQAQLDAQRGVLSDAHPTIQNLRQDIAALSLESPQVAGLREEQRRLREEYAARLALEQGKAVPSPGPVYRLAPPQAQSNEESEQVRQARFEYQQMVDRTNAALLDLDNARVGFKYRYEVVWPAQVPKKPVSPNPFKVFGLGFVGALGLAVLAAAWSARRSGRILVDWQVERTLDLPILGRIGR
jgi:uncharacterized protein involved in exopolysaccharide biosynthesis